MIRTTIASVLTVFALATPAIPAGGGDGHIEDVDFSFEGPFGTYDQHQLQRGLQIYTENCSGCHGLRYVPIRSLTESGGPALPEDQVRAYAAELFVPDERANPKHYDPVKDEYVVTYTSNFPANPTVGAPDLSMMAKARAGFHGPYGLGLNQLFKGMGGPEYIVAILTSYTGEEKTVGDTTLYENTAYPGGWISMSPPLSDGAITFEPEHANDVHHLAEDAAAFLMWAAEPKLAQRKQAGLVGVLMLAILSVLLYLTNKALWAPVKKRAKSA